MDLKTTTCMQMNYSFEIVSKIQTFVGDINDDHLSFVESFLSDQMALFMPVGGHCGYSISKNHIHPCPMITIHFDDLGMLELNGQEYQSKADTTFFLAANVPHQELATKRPARFLALFIPAKLLNETAIKYNCSLETLPVAASFSTPGGLIDSLKIFMEESRSNLPGQKEILNGIVLRICHILVRMLFDINLDPSANMAIITENFRINRVMDYIYHNLDKRITIEELAAIAHLSTSHFSQIFQRETNESPYRYLLLARLQHSRQLLNEGKLNLTEIAYSCGFSSSSHFSAAFQKEFSMSPSIYRKKRVLQK